MLKKTIFAGLIHLPWWLRKRSWPKVYDVFCPQCDWRRIIELGKVSGDSLCTHGEEPAMEIRETLPRSCPECGGRRLKKRRIKVFLRY